MLYGVRPRMDHLLRKYWEVLTMVSRVGRYYGDLFTGSREVTQGDSL